MGCFKSKRWPRLLSEIKWNVVKVKYDHHFHIRANILANTRAKLRKIY